jgi:predicted aspartyl protease
MIRGSVSESGVPIVPIPINGHDWAAIVDTGFNGDLELPAALHDVLVARYVGRVVSELAGGQAIEEDAYLVDFPFDGRMVSADATFVNGNELLIGTHLLRTYRLEINFVARMVELNRLN